MKKTTLLLFILILFNLSYGQSKEKKLQAKFCECIAVSTTLKEGINDEKFDECWNRDTAFIKELVDSLSTNSDMATDDDFYKWGQTFFLENQTIFINECEAWYRFIDSSRYNFLDLIDNKSQLLKIDTLTQFININPSQTDHYRQRGLAYFSLAKYDEAKKDFDKALSLPDASPQNLMFRGWVLELKGEYDAAIADYRLAKELGKIDYMDTVIAVVERKKKKASK